MAALMSLIKVSATNSYYTLSFYIAVSEVEPFIPHVDAIVNNLDDSNPEKLYFRAMVSLARATTLYYWKELPDGFVCVIRSRLIRLLFAYRYVVYLP